MTIPSRRKFSHWLMMVCLVFALGQPLLGAADEGIDIREFSIYQDTDTPQLLADVKLDFQLNDYLREGLLNGMSLESEVSFQLEWHNSWWWNETKPLDSVKTELKYHSLSQHYQLVRLDTNEHWNFSTLVSALDKMGSLKSYALPTLPKNAYHNDAAIFVTATLKPQALELPLKVQALFSDRYSLESEGVMWPIP